MAGRTFPVVYDERYRAYVNLITRAELSEEFVNRGFWSKKYLPKSNLSSIVCWVWRENTRRRDRA